MPLWSMVCGLYDHRRPRPHRRVVAPRRETPPPPPAASALQCAICPGPAGDVTICRPPAPPPAPPPASPGTSPCTLPLLRSSDFLPVSVPPLSSSHSLPPPSTPPHPPPSLPTYLSPSLPPRHFLSSIHLSLLHPPISPPSTYLSSIHPSLSPLFRRISHGPRLRRGPRSPVIFRPRPRPRPRRRLPRRPGPAGGNNASTPRRAARLRPARRRSAV
jgi:hypothetical protein